MSQSFAEKYGKKSSSFTSQALQKKTEGSKDVTFADEQSDKSSSIESSLNSKNNIKSVDPKKKMQADLIYLVKGLDAGRNAWYYVLVDRLKLQLFLKALNDDIIHLENYGKILFSAYGEEPPAEVTDALKEEYGI